jgi:hypothetical protein
MMGLSVRDVRESPLPALTASFGGFAEFHGGKKNDVSDDEFLAVLAEEMEAGRA